MSISRIALSAYQSVQGLGRSIDNKVAAGLAKPEAPRESFTKTLTESVGKVNELQMEKTNMVQAFASGESQNVHELMISLQKAGMAMSMTTAVRGKVLETYRELVKMQF